MVGAITKFLADRVDYRIPQGGLFVWLTLKRPLPSHDLLKKSLEEGVSFVPGSRFLIEKSEHEHYLRLNFTYQSDEAIVRGVERIGRVLDSFR